MRKWQSIKTAPKDGADILVFENDIYVASWVTNIAGLGQWLCEDDRRYGKIEPLLWQPLPDLPSPKEQLAAINSRLDKVEAELDARGL